MRTATRLASALAKNRYKTAISRTDYSRPIRTALADGLIRPGVSVFDYGCGLGDDVRHLSELGVNSWGWDPRHRRDGPLVSADVVNLGYVVNVIEDARERAECLARAWSYAEKVLIVSARLASQTPNLTPGGRYADGCVTSVSTFQRLYEQGELKEWLDVHLDRPAVAAGPGVFYVFRSSADRIGFLASRFQRRARAALASVQPTVEEHKDLLRPLVEFFEEHGRAPAGRRAAQWRTHSTTLRQLAACITADRKGPRAGGVAKDHHSAWAGRTALSRTFAL